VGYRRYRFWFMQPYAKVLRKLRLFDGCDKRETKRLPHADTLDLHQVVMVSIVKVGASGLEQIWFLSTLEWRSKMHTTLTRTGTMFAR